jgi:hypothetical protein
LHLDDWSGRIYVLRDRKGRSAVVENLGALWTEAERLAGRTLDPLDPELLAFLAGGASRRAEPGSGAPPDAAGGTRLSGPVPG